MLTEPKLMVKVNDDWYGFVATEVTGNEQSVGQWIQVHSSDIPTLNLAGDIQQKT